MSVFKIIFKSRIFRLGAAIVLLIFIISKFDINILTAFEKLKNPYYILLVLLLSLLVNPIIASKRWNIFLAELGIKMKLSELIRISFSSVFYAFLLPSGQASDGFRMYSIEKLNPENRGFSGGTVIADRMIGFIVFCMIASLGSFFLPTDEKLANIKLAIFSFTLLLIVITFLITNKAIYSHLSGLFQKIPYFKSLFNYLDKLHLGLTKIPYKRILPKVLPLVVVYQLANITIAYLIFLAFDQYLPFYYHLALIPVIQVITVLPVSIANLGFREGLFIYFYNFINVDEEISFTVSLMYLILTGLVSALVGGLVVLMNNIKKSSDALDTID